MEVKGVLIQTARDEGRARDYQAAISIPGGLSLKCKTDLCTPLAVLSASLLVTFSNASATLWHIKADGSGDAPTIQSGIDLSADGDTVLVASGVYTGDGNRDIDFLGKAILVIAECRYDTTVTDSTVIDCTTLHDYNHRGFWFHSEETSASILEGFSIIHGELFSDSQIGREGAGILCDSTSSPTIRYNTIRDCKAFTGGSGIACFNSSSPRILNNDIYHNTVTYSNGGYGYGILCLNGSVLTIENNRIHDNEGTAGDFGGDAGVGIYAEADSIYMRNNYIARNHGGSSWGAGILIGDSWALIQDNQIVHNSVGGYTAGAGIHIDNSVATISGNLISDNTGDKGTGAGIYISASAVFIIDNDIINNELGEGDGGGIYVSSSEIVSIRNNRIEWNDSGYTYRDSGGGVCISAHPESDISNNIIANNIGCGISCKSSILINSNLITGNYNSNMHLPGGIHCNSSSPTIINNTISDNTGRTGGGAYFGHLSSAQLHQNIITNNRGIGYPEDYPGCGIFSDSPDIVVSCCDVYNNDNGDYIGIPDQTGINGNISVDPMFCDPGNGDYSIDVQSLCAPGNHPDVSDCGLIGALDPTCDHTSTLLLGHEASMGRSAITVSWTVTIDLGPGDFLVQRASGSERFFAVLTDRAISGDGTSFTVVDDRLIPGETYRYRVILLEESGPRTLFEMDPITVPVLPLTLYQNHPNPFNPSTLIPYYLPVEGRVVLSVFDVSGRLVVRLLDETRERGHHSLVWDGLDGRGAPMSSGIYFCRLTAGKETVSRKMILLR